ncbi:hypothetical protein O1611_g4042 [Lasiodiplodia mahajangana]|uniref:Uncharacterized protein n=1 Tax=Lasiodiplodia mahajangana TaxID=1108764 RepID=A0ACC2JQ89_9PEZI|nr:hypothetical protein O1611_g4042 [Lasiodiplodia mahajangana]
MSPTLTRKNLADLSTEEKDNLVRAFRAIQSLPPSDPDSYFTIAGYHGIPGSYYCHHGDVLFPTWHRAYLNRLEKALQKQVRGVTMPYWNQLFTLQQGTPIPTILTDEMYRFTNGTVIPNPLYSYTLQQMIADDGKGDGGHQVGLYNKPQGYATVRYPFSGLISDKYKQQTEDHNRIYEALGSTETTSILNTNVFKWLFASSYVNDKGKRLPAGIRYDYRDCLNAPNYTVFSNTSSAEQWNDDHRGTVVRPLEKPHNNMHAAVGGFEVPGDDDFDYIHFANGDMGENETAAFDPIFFFHHCWIDYMFWNWQVRHNSTDRLTFMRDGYKGVGHYKPYSPLEPFKRDDGHAYLTSQDVANIANLGYKYDHLIPETREGDESHEVLPIESTTPRLKIPNLSRRNISGTFVISVWVKNDQDKYDLISADAILSRWNLSSCGNCQEHLDFQHFVPLLGWSKEDAELAEFKWMLHTRQEPDGLLGGERDLPRLELETGGI